MASPIPAVSLLLPRVLAACGIVWLTGAAPPVGAESKRPASDLAAGEAAYRESCARCHGATGRGDGLDAKRFYPRPRDLTLGVYKFRSTASGTPPSDEDLLQVIARGLPGTNMPDWPHLDEATRWHLVEYLKSLSPIFTQAEPTPVAVPEDPGPSRADLKKGQAIYAQMGCAACHGDTGRANGTSAAGLVDDWGMPIRPANLAQGWTYRGGADPRAITLRVLAGIDGSGMPSYAEAITPVEDVWHLAYYVAALQEPPNWNMIAHALPVTGGLPAGVDDPRWAQAERTDVRLRNVVNAAGEWVSPPTVRAVAIRAAATDREIAIHVSWDDPTQDAADSPDGLALVLKPASGTGDVVTLQAWPYTGAPALNFCYWSAATGRTVESLAADFDAVRQAGGRGVARQSAATYGNGRWHLVIRRPLEPDQPAGAAALTPALFGSVAFAVWDGGNPDARAVSPWIDLALPRKARSGNMH